MVALLSSRFFERQWWNAERFGVTPNKLSRRIKNTGLPKILCISIPKAGTHLVERALCKHPRLYRPLIKTVDEANLPTDGFEEIIGALRPGQVIFSHLFYTQERARLLRHFGVHCIFMVRDLRDIVISEAHYLSSSTNHVYHQAFVGAETSRDRILTALEGDQAVGLPSMSQLFDGFSGWLASDAQIIRFEDLIGERGGGNTEQQLNTLAGLYAYLNMPNDCFFVKKMASTIFSTASPTFNRGHVKQWSQLFDNELKARFKQLTGDAIVQYGYEESMEW